MIVRVFSFGGSRVQIDCDGPAAVRLVDFLFGDLPPSDGPAPHVTLTVRTDQPDGTLTLTRADALLFRGSSEAALARILVERTLYHLSDRAEHGLLLHAAAVTRHGRCLLLPGKSGAGKTTLTTWLVAQGLGYLTDELVNVPLDSWTVIPFVRPLNIRASAHSVLAARGVDLDAIGRERLAGPDATMVRPSAVNAVVAAAGSPLAAVVFPQYRADVAFSAEPLSKAQAGLALLGCLINARNLPGHGFNEVTRLARDIPAFRIQYHDLEQVSAWMEGILPNGRLAAQP